LETGQTGLEAAGDQVGFRARDESRFGSGGRGSGVGLESLQVVSLLDVLHLVINTSLEEVATLSLRGTMDHAFPIVVVVLLQ
jgi:hypothetical protein